FFFFQAEDGIRDRNVTGVQTCALPILGDFLARGQRLMGQCANEKVPAPDVEANKWAEEVENYLQKELGPEYVARFRNAAGMPLSASSIQDPAHRNLWGGLNVRVYRLEQFLSELRD